jgi:hypothetical protein
MKEFQETPEEAKYRTAPRYVLSYWEEYALGMHGDDPSEEGEPTGQPLTSQQLGEKRTKAVQLHGEELKKATPNPLNEGTLFCFIGEVELILNDQEQVAA